MLLKKTLSINDLFRQSALWLHAQHAKAYSYYKVRESGLSAEVHLNATERDFFCKLKPSLQGNSLVVYDIGAATGIVSSCLAKLPNVVSVQAFEPIPEVYENLVEKMRSLPKVHCHNVALGNTEGSSTMYISNKTDCSSLLPMAKLHKEQLPVNVDITHQIQVLQVRLDDYVQQHQLPSPHLVKIDVQGYEQKIIEGAIKTICQAKYCVLEMSFQPLYENSPLFDDIYRLMREIGFKLVGLTSPLTGKSGLQLQVDGIFENQNFKSYAS